MASLLHPTDEPRPPPTPKGTLTDKGTQELLDNVEEEKRRAREEPGLSWRDWLYFSGFRWWSVIAFLVLDSWVAVEWISLGIYLAIAPSLLLAAYAEFLLYQVLWYRPELPLPRRRPGERFRPSWVRPVEVGRWTPEKALLDRGAVTGLPPDAIDPNEFL